MNYMNYLSFSSLCPAGLTNTVLPTPNIIPNLELMLETWELGPQNRSHESDWWCGGRGRKLVNAIELPCQA